MRQISKPQSTARNPSTSAAGPSAKPEYADAQLVADMALAQRVVSLGRAARESANLKMRQPLAEAFVGVTNAREAEALQRLADDVIKEELNVKAVHDRDRQQRPGGRGDPRTAQAARPEVRPPLPGDQGRVGRARSAGGGCGGRAVASR